ncbi:MAG TPA: hypothetical protein VF720_01550 [Candidatus Eisenbacteria bacterium]
MIDAEASIHRQDSVEAPNGMLENCRIRGPKEANLAHCHDLMTG